MQEDECCWNDRVLRRDRMPSQGETAGLVCLCLGLAGFLGSQGKCPRLILALRRHQWVMTTPDFINLYFGRAEEDEG